jgi:glycosyltransferase involved in cell wall biosynthesis
VSITDASEVAHYKPDPWEEVIPLRPMGARRLMEDMSEAPAAAHRLGEIYDEFKPDIVHLHHFDSLFTPVANFVARCKAPVVMTVHDAKLVCPIATLVLPDGTLCEGRILPRCQFTGCEVGFGLPYKLEQDRVFRRLVAPHISMFIAPSHAAAGFLARHGFGPSKVIPSFVDIPEGVLASPPEMPSVAPTVGYLGRLEKYKGAGTLLQAVALARKAIPGLRVIIAGRGPYEEALRQQAHDLGLDKDASVEFPGWVSGKAKEEFFGKIHLLAVPSEGYENFGLIGLEAMARGRPCVGSRLGGIPDWLEDGVVGLLVPPHDENAWAASLVSAFKDMPRLNRWGQQAKQRYLERFQPSVQITSLLAFYQDVMSSPKK